MGRKRDEGPKQLARVIDNPRFVRVFLTKDNRQLPSMLVSSASYDKIVAGFERRGFHVEKAEGG